MKKKNILFVSLTIWASCLSAQEKWSLHRCMEYAITNNIDIQTSKLDIETQKINLNTKQMSRLPDLSGGVGQGFGFGRSADREGVTRDQSSTNTSFNLGASMPIFTGLRQPNEVKMQKLDIAASLQNLEKAKEDIALGVAGYYLQALFSYQLEQIANNNVALSEAQLKETSLLVEAGKKTITDKLDAEAQLASSEQQLIERSNNLNISLLNLMQLINLQLPVDQFLIEAPEDLMILAKENILPHPDVVYAYSEVNRPGIQASKLNIESSKKYIKVAQSGYYPKLNLSAGYSTNYYNSSSFESPSFKSQFKNNASQSINLSLSVPIFDRLSTRNSVRQARIGVKKQELALAKRKQDLYKEIQQAYYNALAAQKKYSATELTVEASKAAYDNTRKQFEAGRISNLDLTNAQNRLDEAQSNLAQSKYDFIFRCYILNFYKGDKLY